MAHSARHKIGTTNENSKGGGGGLFSNVFSFMSREIESFLVNATGGEVKADPGPSRGRVRSSGRRRRDGGARERNNSEDEARQRSRRHRDRERRRRTKPDEPGPKPRSKSTDTTTKRPHRHARPAYLEDADAELSASDRERSKSPEISQPEPPTVPAPTRTLKKQPSITMPGSLFPRSSSLELDEREDDRRVRFASDKRHSAQSQHETVQDEPEAGPSRTNASDAPELASIDPNGPPMDQYVSPWRTRSVSSVKDAVHRFNNTDGIEADFSLLLPSPHSSPSKASAKSRSDTDASPQRSSVVPSNSGKGKERAREDENDDDDLAFIVGETSGHIRVHVKERELNAAREEQREHERRTSGDHSSRASDERERDKQRIKALEEEVRQLKEELSRSQRRSPGPPLSSSAPPPPPPPPPPPLPPPHPIRIDTTPYTPTHMFASARASLRHTDTPIEAPINDLTASTLGRTRRTGMPTVNVPSDKMAAFLNEMKTVRLRKVGSGGPETGSTGVGGAGPSGLSKSVSAASSGTSSGAVRPVAQDLLRRRSLANLRVPIGSSLAAPVPPSLLAKASEVRAGQKRKADAMGIDELTDALRKSSFSFHSRGIDSPDHWVCRYRQAPF
ncbi:hypothetical protein HYDPIDRAFT_149777 [Hydnomerulius pinastri MD-312]|nr:hypothetical protein HYDPIDRAFT_149777 [Hydnomerulius pinastri MD-312]